VIQLKLTKLKLEVFKSDFQHEKKDMNIYEFAISWKNFARVRLQFRFALIIRHLMFFIFKMIKLLV